MMGELNAEQIEMVLHNNLVGRIGCYAQGRVYVVPITYAYSEGMVIGHTTEGLKLKMLRENPECCFEVDNTLNTSSWQSVIAWGTFEVLHGKDAHKHLLKFIHRFMPLMFSKENYPLHGLAHERTKDFTNNKAVVFRLLLKEKTGRFERY